MQQFDVIIIGQGYAGLKAGSMAAQGGLKGATVEAMFPGGLVMSINDLSPAPEGAIPSGPELTGTIAMENMDNGLTNISGEVASLTRNSSGLWVVDAGETLAARNVIIASGAKLRKLGIPGEEEFAGRGVSECADCDGPIFMGKHAVVVGGGDSAFQEAVALMHYVAGVTIVMRGSAPRARAELVAAVEAIPAITVVPNTTVTAILGEDTGGVTGVALAGENAPTLIECSAVFAFIGLDPQTTYLPEEIARDADGALVTDDRLAASEDGIWAIGAARSGFGGLLSDADIDAAKVIAAITQG